MNITKQREKTFEQLVRETAAEGAVLLKNDNVLPFRQGECISVFGRAQIDYYRSGTGSGGAVNVAYTTNLLDGLLGGTEAWAKTGGKKSAVKINGELAKIYRRWVVQNPFDNGGGGWAAEPWFQKDMPLTEEIVSRARQVSDKAVYVIGRTAGEDKDNAEEPGSFLLTGQEYENLKCVAAFFEEIVLVLNCSNIIDLQFTKEDGLQDSIKAILLVWQGGLEGGNAAADVLLGNATPGGKLPDTIAYQYKDYPSSSNYGNEDRNFYQEDIYVGYRYFETFCPEKVMYEFGYGLSYTDFTIEVLDAQVVSAEEGEIKITVLVKNIGSSYAGKEVVQVYLEAPQGKLCRPAKELAAFAKTKELRPKESEILTLNVSMPSLAAYDDGNITGHKSCYVLEEGSYALYVGNSVRNVKKVALTGKGTEKGDYCIKTTKVVRKCEEALAPSEVFQRMKPGCRKQITDKTGGNGKAGTGAVYEIAYEDVPRATVDLEKRIEERMPEEIEMTGDMGYTLQMVDSGEVTMEEFVAQFTREDLACIVRGEGMGHPDVTPGTASAFGAVSDKLEEYGLPLACAADGPSGVRMENGEFAVQLPIGTLLAATWDVELIRQLYTLEGREVRENQVDTLLGPGINIHRDPLNGRNFEYYSEDPLLTGKMAAAVVSGMKEGGSIATIKHFAANNQEHRRSFIDAAVSERALREIYLKGYEMAVREGGALSVMTSYNPINGYYAASSYDLNTTLLRREWGFEGIVMTDWWAKMNDVVHKGKGVVTKTRDMVRAQNDLYMVVNNYGAELNANHDDTLQALEEGRLTVGELQRCAINICRFLMKTAAFEMVGQQKKEAPLVEPLAEKVIGQQEADGSLVAGSTADGKIPLKMGETLYLRITEEGEYTVLASVMSVDSNMVQNTAQIKINGTPTIFVQTQGTAGKWITQKLQKVRLKQGLYCIQPEVVKPHMEMEWIWIEGGKAWV